MQQLKSIKLTKKGAKIVYPKTFAPKKNEMKISGDYVCNGKYKPHSDLTDILDGLAAFIYKFVSGDKAYFDEANVGFSRGANLISTHTNFTTPAQRKPKRGSHDRLGGIFQGHTKILETFDQLFNAIKILLGSF